MSSDVLFTPATDTTGWRINGDRLWASLMDLAQIGATPKGGCRRLTLTDLDRQGRDKVIGWAREAGMSVTIDKIGNVFMRREGRNPGLPPIVSGSHIDTQPTGEQTPGDHPIGAYFEAHIEQGPILEDEAKTIGIVQGVLGIRWYDCVVTGQASHAGPTPMRLRQDALQVATRIMQEVVAIAGRSEEGRGTVGSVQVWPNSRNVVPGEVTFSIDMRNLSDALVDEMDRQLRAFIAEVERESGLQVALKQVSHYPAAPFDAECQQAIADAAQRLGYPARPIVSGAGHDAVYMSYLAPTGMIFIPCKDGISHNEIEYASPEHVAAGANVLLQVMLQYARPV
ncbi:Zn-dependent hydrolase [Klebsiella pneumoniae]|uniref:Zn-dependent hydrolase n=1 Tax=Klebsiella pneumoniae TaxID=573 RepID=UPI00293108B3|nr:Zn-dependent hydrolase [Klebsiella pneumoniae]